MKRLICAAAALAAIALASPAIAQPSAARNVCLEPIRFDRWKAVNDSVLIVTDKLKKNYRITLAPGCFDVSWVFNIGIQSFTTSRLGCVSRGDYVLVPAQAGIPRQRCLIDKVEAYTPDMQRQDALSQVMMKKGPR
jgi:hypothetical protein